MINSVFWFLLSGLFLGVVILVLIRVLSSAYTPPIKDDHGDTVPGSIAELCSIPVNGVDQWLLIRGVNLELPLLLFIHGGPGTGMIGIARKYQQLLEQHFMVVQWDQRGAGLTGMKPVDSATLNLEQFVADGLRVTRYLLDRFNKKNLYLVGHSWGSGLGYILAYRYPEYYSAFFGIGQISHKTEPYAYAATLAKAREKSNQKAIRALEELGPPPYREVARQPKTVAAKADKGNSAMQGMLIRYQWSARLGGDAKNFSISRIFIRDLLISREYSLKTAIMWIKNKSFSINHMYKECNEQIDLFTEGTKFSIPLFFLLGRDDLLTVPKGAVELFEAVQAPHKELIWFDSGHEIPWEKVKEYQQAIIERMT